LTKPMRLSWAATEPAGTPKTPTPAHSAAALAIAAADLRARQSGGEIENMAGRCITPVLQNRGERIFA
jgi:hypothetical protein